VKNTRNKKGSSPTPDITTPAATDETATEAIRDTPQKYSKDAKQKADVETPLGEMVTIIKTGFAAKLSPRGDGALTFQVGRIDDTIHLRIFHNESAGRFSREWVSVEAIRSALAKLPKGQSLFKAAVGLKPAWKGQSSCNSGFGAAILKSEGVFVSDAEKKGMMRLTEANALDKWEQSLLALKVPKDAEKVPLHPPKVVPNFGGRTKGGAKSRWSEKGDAQTSETDENTVLEDDPSATSDDETGDSAPVSPVPTSRADGLPELEDEV
jgi:hypothetical protein